MATQKPPYQVTKELHPDDVGEVAPPDDDYAPRKGERLADVLDRVGAIRKAAKRIMEAMDAQLPQGWPDYRIRVLSAGEARDTIEGPLNRKVVPPPKGDADGLPEPGMLRAGKAKAGGDGTSGK